MECAPFPGSLTRGGERRGGGGRRRVGGGGGVWGWGGGVGLDGEGRQNGWQQGKHQRLNSGFSPGR